ncbi:hypothetical protein FB451DRAFT_1241910, partial [Mycena latifolia]
MLSSIHITAHRYLDIDGVLRAIRLYGGYTPISLVSVLPWAQLTGLDLLVSINFDDARDILAQCEMIQECMLHSLFNSGDLEPPQRVHQLNYLHRLTIGSDEEVPAEFFEAFSFPKLLHLVISTEFISPRRLHALYDRSTFCLTAFELHSTHITAEDLIPFLQQLPALQTLHLEGSVQDALFKAFTYPAVNPVSSFTLPRLRSLTIVDTGGHDAYGILRMVDSVRAHAGGNNAASPALAVV